MNYIEEDEPIFRESPPLRATRYSPEQSPSPELALEPPDPLVGRRRPDPGITVLGLTSHQNHSDSIEDACDQDTEMTDTPIPPAPDEPARSNETAATVVDDEPSPAKVDLGAASNAKVLQATAALVLSRDSSNDSSAPPRIDSARDSREKVPQLPAEKRTYSSEASPPLTIQTIPQPPAPASEESLASSPILRKQMIEGNAANTLPAVSPQQEESSTVPHRESLPPFHQLAYLAETATQQATQHDVRAQPSSSHHQSPSFGSIAQSPVQTFHHPHPFSTQTSPTAYAHSSARSPTSTLSDGHHYASPQQPTPQGYYSDRRSSTATEGSRPFLANIPSLPSQSSSGDSYATNASSDGHSTSHTASINEHMDPNGRLVLPPPPGMITIPTGSFKCDFDGCTAPPFQTQYLLSSHRNVHSQNRPHYCPVSDCPRSEGGKGFKRKNEMIRHGLVHNSPGYVCPFCPDREHRYPRPDNLQRHVRVHHPDRNRDDQALRDVLALRQEGSAQKQRRRRTQSTTDAPPDAAPSTAPA
ncbi:Metallothionein expression activator [Lecanosticta acicola]|uniref:Metallothionein expression activator n=1 Tax=Lecanosticta acicola TaxID=111012 RepID=A0AAI8Z1B8_9PEZI|nr:Metallothionein expression activator [Lecanosticta acicola]